MSSCLTEVYRKEMGSEDGGVLQWNRSNLDTVHISEVTGVSKKLFLGEEKVSLLERCPRFKRVPLYVYLFLSLSCTA